MKVITPIAPTTDIPTMLRGLADRIESGDWEHAGRVTVICGKHVMCFGPVSRDRAAEQAIFDMTWGVHWMMTQPAKLYLEEEN